MTSNTPQARTRGIFRKGSTSLFATAGVVGALLLGGTAYAQTANTAPVANADVMTVVEDTSTILTVLTNDTDADSNTLTISGFTQPAHGSLISNLGVSLTYVPAANYSGADSFGYTISDGNGGTATATVAVTVTPVNDAPVAVADVNSFVIGATSIAVLTNDTDADGNTLTLVSATPGAHGTTSINGANVLYTPATGYVGADSFTYVVSDGQSATATGTVTVTVVPAGTNVPPVAVNDTVSVKVDTAKTITVLANDTDANSGDTLALVSVTSPAHGTAVVNATGTVTYTPVAAYLGSDSFTYVVRDAAGLTATGTVNITVKAATSGDDDDDDGDHANKDDKDACKKGGWLAFLFRNQGQCVSTAARGGDIRANVDHQDDDRDHEDDHDGDDESNRSSDSRGKSGENHGNGHGNSQGKGKGRN